MTHSRRSTKQRHDAPDHPLIRRLDVGDSQLDQEWLGPEMGDCRDGTELAGGLTEGSQGDYKQDLQDLRRERAGWPGTW